MVPEHPMTYGQLDEALRGLGFSVNEVPGKSKTYHHTASGALLPLPDRPGETPLTPHHLVAAQAVLRDFGLGNLEDYFRARAERATNEMAWRAFVLGARVALASRGVAMEPEAIAALVGPLYALAGRDACSPGSADCIVRIGNVSLRTDRQLAERIVQGCDAAAEVTEGRDVETAVTRSAS